MKPFLLHSDLVVSFSPASLRDEKFQDLFMHLSNDPLTQWIASNAIRKDEQTQSEALLIQLVVELHRKVSELETRLDGGSSNAMELEFMEIKTSGVGFEYIELCEDLLEDAKSYFAIATLPIFPKKMVVFYFSAVGKNLAHITKMHANSESEWNRYITQLERKQIQKLKEFSDES
ncbi:MAG: hypothetical protein WCR69_00190 [Sulfuricurvum sp.]